MRRIHQLRILRRREVSHRCRMQLGPCVSAEHESAGLRNGDERGGVPGTHVRLDEQLVHLCLRDGLDRRRLQAHPFARPGSVRQFSLGLLLGELPRYGSEEVRRFLRRNVPDGSRMQGRDELAMAGHVREPRQVPSPIPRRRSFGVVAAVVVLFGLACQKKQPAASAPTQFEEGALPPGCVVAARADLSALGPLGDAVRRAVTVDAEQEPALAGFDVHNFQRASFCKMPDAQAGSFVALLAGTIPADLVETIGKRSAGALSQGTMAGAPFVEGKRVWFARRLTRQGGGELVVASTRGTAGRRIGEQRRRVRARIPRSLCRS